MQKRAPARRRATSFQRLASFSRERVYFARITKIIWTYSQSTKEPIHSLFLKETPNDNGTRIVKTGGNIRALQTTLNKLEMSRPMLQLGQSDSKIYYGTGPGIMNFLVYRTQPNESQTLPRKKKKKKRIKLT